jgi:hypothetical protein
LLRLSNITVWWRYFKKVIAWQVGSMLPKPSLDAIKIVPLQAVSGE